jgi:hypothetical protein
MPSFQKPMVVVSGSLGVGVVDLRGGDFARKVQFSVVYCCAQVRITLVVAVFLRSSR